MPKKTSNKLKQEKKNMIKTGLSDIIIVKHIDHKQLALQSDTYKKHNK